jgi:hypothetical protein
MKKLLFIPMLFVCYLSMGQTNEAPSLEEFKRLSDQVKTLKADLESIKVFLAPMIKEEQLKAEKLKADQLKAEQLKAEKLKAEKERLRKVAAGLIPPSIGDAYQDGIVFYILKSGDRGYDANNLHGLIAAPKDLEVLSNWDDAKRLCQSLGKGWRLPTRDELDTLNVYKDIIGGFANFTYWSASEDGVDRAYNKNFKETYDGYGISGKKLPLYVRAIRAF